VKRLFVAAWLPAAARAEAAEAAERLRSAEADVRWVPPENLHVTLRFLGDVEGDRVDDLAGCLSRALVACESFRIRLSGLGRFPSRGAPRVVWAGMEQGKREIASLASVVEKALLNEGFLDRIEERPFRAHVTLGRPRSSRGVGRLLGLLEELPFDGRMHLFEEVRLVESRLSPRGANYHTVARFPLREGDAAGSISTDEGDT